MGASVDVTRRKRSVPSVARAPVSTYADQSCAACAISSRERPTKFHHM